MQRMMHRIIAALAGCAMGAAFAQQPANAQAYEAEATAAFAAAREAMKEGPTQVQLNNEAHLNVPAGFVFVPKEQSLRVLKAMGNRPSPDTLGMIFPQAQDEHWFMVARFHNSGYVKDDDARDWKADELLKGIKEGTEESNKERKARGIPEMEIVGWVQTPTYDAATHRLVWSLASKDKGAPAGAEQGVNYNTYLLGREGYISMNLVTDLNAVEAQKPIAKQLLAAVEFEKGRTYADFNASTDHVAEYGLAALVGGIAAKKLGFFALIAAFAAKFAKLIGLAAIGLFAGIAKLFGRRKEE